MKTKILDRTAGPLLCGGIILTGAMTVIMLGPATIVGMLAIVITIAKMEGGRS